MLRFIILMVTFFWMSPSFATPDSKATFVNQAEEVFTIPNFRFDSGQDYHGLKIHYITFGIPQRDNSGKITNAVLFLHGTTQRASDLLSSKFSVPMFGPGRPLDAAKFFVILPDSIGHGGSSKPSDGERMKFPHYDYTDLINAQYRLVTEKLGINHLVLVGGTSMGGMHAWMWGERYPEMMDALLPIASEPGAIVGRNLLWRRNFIDMIESDPSWQHGNYKQTPKSYIGALTLFNIMVNSPIRLSKVIPDIKAADQFMAKLRLTASEDPNDAIYAVDASRDYNPEPDLERIKARLLAINFEDDELNVAKLGRTERLMPRVRNGRYFLLPASSKTNGHLTLKDSALWSDEVGRLMNESGH